MACTNGLHISEVRNTNPIPFVGAVAYRIPQPPQQDYLYSNGPELLRKGRYKLRGKFGIVNLPFEAGDVVNIRVRWTEVFKPDGEWYYGIEASNGEFDTTEGSKNVIGDTSGLVEGQVVEGDGIPDLATVESITDSSTFVLSKAATATATNHVVFKTPGWCQRDTMTEIKDEYEEVLQAMVEKAEHSDDLFAPWETSYYNIDPPDDFGTYFVRGPRANGTADFSTQEQRVAVVHKQGFAGYRGVGVFLTETASGERSATSTQSAATYSGARKFTWEDLQWIGDGTSGDLYRWKGGDWKLTDTRTDATKTKPHSTAFLGESDIHHLTRMPGLESVTNESISQKIVADGVEDNYALSLSVEDSGTPQQRAEEMMGAGHTDDDDGGFVLDIKNGAGDVLRAQANSPLPNGLLGACRFQGDSACALAKFRYKMAFAIPAAFTEEKTFSFTWSRFHVNWSDGVHVESTVTANITFDPGETLKTDDDWREEDVPGADGFVYFKAGKCEENEAFFDGLPVVELIATLNQNKVADIGRFGEYNTTATQGSDFNENFRFIDGDELNEALEINSKSIDGLDEDCCIDKQIVTDGELWTLTSDVDGCGSRYAAGTSALPKGSTTQLYKGGTFTGQREYGTGQYNSVSDDDTYEGWADNEPWACRGDSAKVCASIELAAGSPGFETTDETDGPPTESHPFPVPNTGDGIEFTVKVKYDSEIGCQDPCIEDHDSHEAATVVVDGTTAGTVRNGGTDPNEQCAGADVPPGAPEELIDVDGGAYEGVDHKVTGTWEPDEAIDFSELVERALAFKNLDDLVDQYSEDETRQNDDGDPVGLHAFVRFGSIDDGKPKNVTTDAGGSTVDTVGGVDDVSSVTDGGDDTVAQVE